MRGMEYAALGARGLNELSQGDFFEVAFFRKDKRTIERRKEFFIECFGELSDGRNADVGAALSQGCFLWGRKRGELSYK